MFKKIAVLAFTLLSLSFGGQLPNTTGVVMTDWDGKTYDLDALLNSGKHVFIHQMYSG
jgi:hypothetical protein